MRALIGAFSCSAHVVPRCCSSGRATARQDAARVLAATPEDTARRRLATCLLLSQGEAPAIRRMILVCSEARVAEFWALLVSSEGLRLHRWVIYEGSVKCFIGAVESLNGCGFLQEDDVLRRYSFESCKA